MRTAGRNKILERCGREELLDRAEKIAGREASRRIASSPEEEKADSLLHDLRVHQIQLEMQNEELQRAKLESDALRSHYHKLFDQAPVGFVLVNTRGIILRANHTIATMLGVEHAKLHRQSLLPFIGPRHRNLYLGRFPAFFAKPEGKHFAMQLVSSSGDFLWARVTGRRLKGTEVFGDGVREPECLLIGITDITEQFRLQKKLNATQRELDQIFNAAVPVCLIGTDHVVIRVNDTYCELLGQPREELEGRKCCEIWSGSACFTENCSMRRILSGHPKWGTEKTLSFHQNGREQKRHCLVVATPFLGENGEIAGIVESLIDITARKQAELAVQESEERFRGIVESASDLIQSIAADGMVAFANRAWRTALGYGQGALPLLHFRDICHPDYLEYCQEIFERVMSGQTVEKIETVFLSSDGREIVVEGILNLHKDASGAPMAVRGIFRDITARKELETTLRHKCMTDELTGIFNRRGFLEMATRFHTFAERNGVRYALLYLDLDNMKLINDQLGHEMGDHALVDLATVLKALFRQSDLVARLGGDEFVVLLAGNHTPEGVQGVAIRLEIEARDFCRRHGRPYNLLMSIGQTLFVPTEGATLEDMLTSADQAMYTVKQQRKKRCPR